MKLDTEVAGFSGCFLVFLPLFIFLKEGGSSSIPCYCFQKAISNGTFQQRTLATLVVPRFVKEAFSFKHMLPLMGIRLKIQLCVRTCRCSPHHLACTSLLCGQAQPLTLFLSSVNPRNKVPGAWWAGVGVRRRQFGKPINPPRLRKHVVGWGITRRKLKKKAYGNKPCPTGVMRFANSQQS